MQLQTYHDQHSYEFVIAFQEKYYGSKLSADKSIATFINFLQELARQLTDFGQPKFDQQLISKSKCGLLSMFDPLFLAWDSVIVADQILPSFQAWLVKFHHKPHDRDHSTEVPLDKVFFAKGSLLASSKSHSSPTVEQI